ncbi:MAG: DUF421 domain-containing protein [Candidatus Rokuibacteriota bacterium]
MSHEIWMTALRASGIYVLMLVVIRLLGKRAVGNFTAFDLLVALMLGEVVDEVIYGDVTFVQGAIAVVVIAGAEYATSWLGYRHRGIHKVLEGVPAVLVQDGRFQPKGMVRERMNEKEVMAELRLQGIDDLREVKMVVLENSGEVSVLKQSWAEPLKKADLDDGAGPAPPPGDPPPDMRPFSPQALGRA